MKLSSQTEFMSSGTLLMEFGVTVRANQLGQDHVNASSKLFSLMAQAIADPV